MTNIYTVEDLVQNLENMRKLKESERLRNFLKFFLVGFFIGRDNKKKYQRAFCQNL